MFQVPCEAFLHLNHTRALYDRYYFHCSISPKRVFERSSYSLRFTKLGNGQACIGTCAGLIPNLMLSDMICHQKTRLYHHCPGLLLEISIESQETMGQVVLSNSTGLDQDKLSPFLWVDSWELLYRPSSS